MSKRKPGNGRQERPRGEVVRRSAAKRKPLPEHLEAFAGGDDDALWRRPAKRRLHDPRPVVLVPGVANRDARAVCDARVRRLRAAAEDGGDEALALELGEAARMRVWRGHSIVGWDAFVENVLGLDRDRADALTEKGAELTGSAEPASDDVVATWMRAEAGLIEALGTDSAAAVRLRGAAGEETLGFDVPAGAAAAALAAMGRRAAPVAREQAQAPKTVVDRPKGVRRISRMMDEEEG